MKAAGIASLRLHKYGMYDVREFLFALPLVMYTGSFLCAPEAIFSRCFHRIGIRFIEFLDSGASRCYGIEVSKGMTVEKKRKVEHTAGSKME